MLLRAHIIIMRKLLFEVNKRGVSLCYKWLLANANNAIIKQKIDYKDTFYNRQDVYNLINCENKSNTVNVAILC